MLNPRTTPRPVTIVYRRLPCDVREYPAILLEATSNRLVIESSIEPTSPLIVFGNSVADKGFTAIWFIYRNRWYDIGKFYDKSRKWIGYYCDILKPSRRLLANSSRTAVLTDLFLDLWIGTDGRYAVLDEAELKAAIDNHDIANTLAREAKRQMDMMIRRVKAGRFPPRSVQEMQLDNRSSNR